MASRVAMALPCTLGRYATHRKSVQNVSKIGAVSEGTGMEGK